MPRSRYKNPGLAMLLVAVGALAGHAASASRLPDPVIERDYNLLRVGAGELSWLGRPIYDASLWTSAGRFEGYVPGAPMALSLWYQRDFSREQLLRITNTAWRLLGAAPREQLDRWLSDLRGIWVDVGPGDNMTAVVVPGQPTRFYDDQGFRGQIDDPAFGPAFLSIWLDSRSVVGELRLRLLGLDRTVANR